MFCRNCGSSVPDGSRFCPGCGSDVSGYATQSQPQPQPQPQPVTPPVNIQPALGMGWFKLLIYFGLWAGALLNFGTAISLLTGSVYGEKEVVELVYAVFPDLKPVDLIVGISLIALAIWGIITRFRLSGYHKNGLLCLNCTYAAGAIINLGYLLAAGSIVSFDVLGDSITSSITSVVVSIVMIIVNTVYFGKRKHLFVN